MIITEKPASPSGWGEVGPWDLVPTAAGEARARHASPAQVWRGVRQGDRYLNSERCSRSQSDLHLPGSRLSAPQGDDNQSCPAKVP